MAKFTKEDFSTVDALVNEEVVTLDRRGSSSERRDGNPEALDTGVMKNPRRKKQRRRHIDPTTCERDYNDAEIEFMRAMDDYKQDSGRMFPTCSEVLEVIRGLGYVQLSEDQADSLGLVCEEFDGAEEEVSEESHEEELV
ncbi:hypothetical protein LF1_27240 [Rubripirellula obstinata]|uniref:Uncharacterized protein n=1 Tax=Rubripirellula obstinata TaxID=406547 RepID=A0A5B1CJT3_9BACT|nr:hypothetical protein [Rubripirellula obstinata]KAA1260185.1 hypothetical protein LF1_27240 [Rubripirellula obstinata]